MQITLQKFSPQANADVLGIAVFNNGWAKDARVKTVDAQLKGAIAQAGKDEDFKGEKGQTLVLNPLGALKAKRIVLMGLGSAKDLRAKTLIETGGSLTKQGNAVGAKSAVLSLPEIDTALDVLALVARGCHLGGYRFIDYKSDAGRKPTLSKIGLTQEGKGASAKAAKESLARAADVADGVFLARDLVNTSPLQLYPETFCKKVGALAKKVGLKVKVLAPAELKKMNMNLLLGVGAGSSRAPRLLHLSYEPAGAKKAGKPIVLVGKGMTFDSGGLSLKPPASMVDMKADMGGGAAVVGAMLAIAKQKPKTAVHGIVGLAENMPSGTAIRPDDVITSASGKTVEINNTDAEGRLVLADALHYAGKLGPKYIIDLATLTGACMVALGPHTVGAFANDEDLASSILSASEAMGESFWRMPLNPDLNDQLKSNVADLKNTGERWGGAITAALFLQNFAGEQPWAHLDIAGPAMSGGATSVISKGGTGVAVATLVDLIC